MSKHRRHIANKWAKHRVLRKSRKLSRVLPETQRLRKYNLRKMLRKYGMVYVKPVEGSQGVGVMKVNIKKGRIRTQIGRRKRSFSSIQSAYAYISGVAGKKPYLVQQGIRMAKYRGRPFDIRIMVQRMPRRRNWRVTGWAARLAHPRKIVTNGSQGGTIYPLRVLLPSSRRMVSRLKRIGVLSARRLHSAYPGLDTIGLDVALDRRRHPWILEANTSPDPCPFTKLPGKRMLRKILAHARAHGRRYRLKCLKSHRGV